jgi:transcriptional regulator with XRE-family HTH domain
MSFIGRNIKKIRIVKKMSQAAFAELFNLARPSVGAYEEERAEPKIDTVIQIANHFGISVDALLTKELTINDLYKFDVHAKEIEKHMQQMKAATTTKNQYSAIRTVLVTKDQHFEYLIRGNHSDYLSALPKILIPGFEKGKYRAFEIHSDEMHDNYSGFNPGDIVIGEELKKIAFKANAPYIIITEKEIHFRRYVERDKSLIFSADNPKMRDIEIDEKDIKECWLIAGYFSREVHPPTMISDRLISLENTVEKMELRIKSLEKLSSKG